mmetsp:Transcript_52890/g.72208  ORF Transcript_52890/g.72208 Transcript_52890/m.72208 type:complete len:237 (+) Transcript_52890:307-1017(+)
MAHPNLTPRSAAHHQGPTHPDRNAGQQAQNQGEMAAPVYTPDSSIDLYRPRYRYYGVQLNYRVAANLLRSPVRNDPFGYDGAGYLPVRCVDGCLHRRGLGLRLPNQKRVLTPQDSPHGHFHRVPGSRGWPPAHSLSADFPRGPRHNYAVSIDCRSWPQSWLSRSHPRCCSSPCRHCHGRGGLHLKYPLHFHHDLDLERSRGYQTFPGPHPRQLDHECGRRTSAHLWFCLLLHWVLR